MASRDDFVAKMHRKIDELNAKIDELGRKARKEKAETREWYEEERRDLEAQKVEAESRLERVRQASGEAWEDLKVGAEGAWKKFKDSVDRAVSRFQGH